MPPEGTRNGVAELGLGPTTTGASNAEHLINISFAALLGGMRSPGASVLAMMAAGVVAFMGAAAMTVPANPGSWGTAGGAAAVAAGIGLCAAVVYEWRRGRTMLVGEVAP